MDAYDLRDWDGDGASDRRQKASSDCSKLAGDQIATERFPLLAKQSDQ